MVDVHERVPARRHLMRKRTPSLRPVPGGRSGGGYSRRRREGRCHQPPLAGQTRRASRLSCGVIESGGGYMLEAQVGQWSPRGSVWRSPPRGTRFPTRRAYRSRSRSGLRWSRSSGGPSGPSQSAPCRPVRRGSGTVGCRWTKRDEMSGESRVDRVVGATGGFDPGVDRRVPRDRPRFRPG